MFDTNSGTDTNHDTYIMYVVYFSRVYSFKAGGVSLANSARPMYISAHANEQCT